MPRWRNLLALDSDEVDRINRELKQAQGFQPVQVADGLDYERFAAVSVRLPDLPGVSPRQGYSRFYPSGAAVGHLIGYVGTVSAEEYQKNKNPLLITPGFKVGKDGLEKTLEEKLQGEPGAKRTEVTARGKIVRELTTRPDTPGQAGTTHHRHRPSQLRGATPGAGVRLGRHLRLPHRRHPDHGVHALLRPQQLLGRHWRIEWKMLNADDHIPMLNKALQGLYPPGSTLKPMAGLALMKHGVDPTERVNCPGGYRLGNRVFKCLGRHGPMDMTSAIMKSCNTYFYAMAHRVGYDSIAPVARELGLGQEFPLPFPSQRYGTVPDSAWKMRKYDQEWTASDTLNAVIGQGYIIASPFQLGLMSARIASGLNIQPEILMKKRGAPTPLSFPKEHLDVVREGMNLVVNGAGTAVRSKLQLENIAMGRKNRHRAGPPHCRIAARPVGRMEISRPWPFRLLRACGPAALWRCRGDRTWHGWRARRRADCQGCADLHLRPRAGDEVARGT